MKPNESAKSLSVDHKPLYELSLNLYMQFMEPLGATDGSVETGWSFSKDRWRSDLIETVQELSPPLLRYGGCFSSFYRWKEGVGPRDQRVPMMNLCWGGIETNQIGTHEFIDFARQVGAQPFYNVNFESDGRESWMKDPKGSVRFADAVEAAEWVDYCNNPDNKLRKSHGIDDPYNLKLWQIGNETSYDERGFDCETTAKKTVEFAKAMRDVDPDLELIAWGDSGWAQQIYEACGDQIQYLAFHHMFNPSIDPKNSPLKGIDYRKDPDATWENLMNAANVHHKRIDGIYQETKDLPVSLAMTECHFALPGRNRCEVLSTWAAGVAYARMANVHERFGDKLKIATLADFCGTTWQVNAVMIALSDGHAYMMPVARIMALYRHHQGTHATNVVNTPDGLDVVSSIEGDRVFLHVVNTQRTKSVATTLSVSGKTIQSGKAFTLADDPEFEVFTHDPEVLSPIEQPIPESGEWTFPPASVTAVELTVA